MKNSYKYLSSTWRDREKQIDLTWSIFCAALKFLSVHFQLTLYLSIVNVVVVVVAVTEVVVAAAVTARYNAASLVFNAVWFELRLSSCSLMALSEWAGPVMLEPELIAGLAVLSSQKSVQWIAQIVCCGLNDLAIFIPHYFWLWLLVFSVFQLVEEQSN